MTFSKKFPSDESGNILIYILGAIFLLGLLVVLIKGSSTPGSNIDEEGLIIRVSEVQEYGMELENAVALIMSNGFSESDIRFAHPDAASAYGDITDTPTRQVFSRSGGGATFREPPSGIQTTVTPWLFNGNNIVEQVGTSCSANGCVDLVALLLNVSEEFCIMINERNDIPNPSDSPPTDPGSVEVTTPFTGSFAFSHGINSASGEFNGKLEGCFEGGGTPAAGTYHYYRVLMAR